MKIDPKNPKHIIADEGKVFIRIADGNNYGSEIYLGITYYIGGKYIKNGHVDTPEDFKEIDDDDDE